MALKEEKKAFAESYAKVIKEKFNRDLTEEELKAIDKQFDPIKAEDIEFRKQEVDITSLSSKKINQLDFRFHNDQLEYNKFMLSALNDIEMLLVLMCEKMGIEKPLEEIENRANNLTKKE